MIRLLLLYLVSLPAFATEIEVRGLFAGAAVLVIDGEKQMLKLGQTSRHGVELIAADTTQAVIRLNGEVKTLHLSDRISSSFEQPAQVQVHIQKTANQQYITTGSINGRPVRFLVDTGANVVAINGNLARSLGIALGSGTKTNATTASEVLPVTAVTIREMQVGEIRQENVRAIIIEGEQPRDILLGMSFLQHVDITENAGLMVLTSKL